MNDNKHIAPRREDGHIRQRTRSLLLQSVPSFNPGNMPGSNHPSASAASIRQSIRKVDESENPFSDGWESDESSAADRALSAARRKKKSSLVEKEKRKSKDSTRYTHRTSVLSSLLDAQSIQDVTTLTKEELIDELQKVKRQRDDYHQRMIISANAALSARLQPDHEQTDYNLMEQVDELRYWIRKWSHKYFSNTSKFSSRTAGTSFGYLTPKYTTLLESAASRARLIQASVWYMLQDMIFSEKYSDNYAYLWLGCKGRRRSWKRRPNSTRQPLETLLQQG